MYKWKYLYFSFSIEVFYVLEQKIAAININSYEMVIDYTSSIDGTDHIKYNLPSKLFIPILTVSSYIIVPAQFSFSFYPFVSSVCLFLENKLFVTSFGSMKPSKRHYIEHKNQMSCL